VQTNTGKMDGKLTILCFY